MTEYIDGHRWPQKVVSPETSREVPADRRDLPAADASRPAVTPPAGSALPEFTVHAGYVMRPDSIALHFPLNAVPALCGAFPQHADALHAAALDVEMEAEAEQDRAYERRPA